MKTNAFLLVVAFLFATQLNASHVAGGHISYEVTHEDSVRISVDVIRDCSGAAWTTQFISIQVSSTCGYRTVEQLNLVSPIYFNTGFGKHSKEISLLCKQQESSSTCLNGSMPSYEVYTYQGTFYLPQAASCSEWEFKYTPPCCFNSNSIINVPTSYTNATLSATYRPNADRNSSMSRSQVPIFHACVNKLITIGLGEKNPDNDSLVYSISSLPTWSNGFAAPNIFGPSTQFDTRTGEILFRATTVGAYYYELEVCEYDRATGVLKGCQSQFGQVLVSNCQNHQPGASTFITSVGGAAIKTGPKSIDVCTNAPYSFSFFVTDSNLADSVFILSDLHKQFSNATIQKMYVAGLKDSLKVTVFDTLASRLYSEQLDYVVRAYDNSCPFIGQRDIRFTVNAIAGTYGGEDHTICRGAEWVKLYGAGGASFQWQVISGDQFDTVPSSPTYNATGTSHGIGGFISVSPSQRTVYAVSGNLSLSCRQHDTVVVDVAPNFNLNSNYSQAVCYGENVPIESMPSPGSLSSYTYNWRPRSLFKNTSRGQATSKPIKDNTSLWVEVISDSGCVKRDSFNMEVKSLPFPKNIKLKSAPTQLCLGDTVKLKSKLKNLNISSCDVQNLPCQGSQTLVSSSINGVYSDSLFNNYTLPNISHTSANGMKSQVIYRASFLKAMGLKKGMISAVSFYIDKVQLADSVLNNLAVKMICTDSTQFNNISFIYGAKHVRSAKPDTVTNGWWTIEFDQPYQWDGNSNLLIELCWQNSTRSNRNHRMMLLGTTYPAFQNFIDQNGASNNVCTEPMAWNQYFTRFNQVPAIRFTSCQGVNNNGFNFNWYTTSGGGVIGSSSKPNLNFSPSTPGTEIVSLVVSDTSGYCVDTITHEIDVVSTFKIRPLINTPKTICVDASPYLLQAQPLPSLAGLTSIWSGAGVVNTNGLFDPGQAGLGKHLVYYSIHGSPCATSDSFKIKVVPPLDASFGLTKSCITDSAAYLLPNVPNGVWQGPGIVNNSAPYLYIDSIGLQLNSGDVDSVTIFHLIDSLGCRTVSQQNVKVFGEFLPQLESLPGFNQRFFCINESPRKLVLAQGNGSWSGIGMSANGTFDPYLAGIGSHTVVVDSNGFCGGSTSYQIEVPQLKNPVINNPGPFCDPQSNQVITVTSNFQGAWNAPLPTGSGVWITSTSSPQFVPSTVVSTHGYGSFPLTLTVSDTIFQNGSQINICSVMDSTVVVFQKLVNVDLGPDIFTCGGVIDTTLNVTGSNVLWSTGTTGNSLRITQPGTYWVQVYSGAGSCQGTDTITVNANCVSINEVAEEGHIEMYPNPTSDVLRIVNTSNMSTGVSIHNASGAVVFIGSLDGGGNTSIVTSTWQSGVYLVQFSGEINTVTKRLVVLD